MFYFFGRVWQVHEYVNPDCNEPLLPKAHTSITKDSLEQSNVADHQKAENSEKTCGGCSGDASVLF